jgi:hypothetical protein
MVLDVIFGRTLDLCGVLDDYQTLIWELICDFVDNPIKKGALF